MTPSYKRFSRSVRTVFVLLMGVQTMGQAAWPSTLVRGLGPEPDSLNIHQAQGLAAINLLRDLREGLLTFDQKGEPAPGQAASWQLLDEGRRYRFTLREDARWSNGDRVTAADFVRGWRRAFSLEKQAATAGLLQGILNADQILAGTMDVSKLGIQAIEPGTGDIRWEGPAPGSAANSG